MTISKSAIVFSLIVSFVAVALLWTSGGSAQQYTGGNLDSPSARTTWIRTGWINELGPFTAIVPPPRSA